MALLIIFFFLSIVFSFLCSLWEASLLSITPSYVEIQLQSESWMGKKLKEYKQNIDKPLSAILTLNTIAHTVGAIGVGAQSAKIWGKTNIDVLGFTTNVEGVVAAIMTLAILILSEIIPKTLGASYWKNLSGFTVRSLHIIIILLYPLVWLSQWITRLLKKDKETSVLSRTDLSAMADMTAKEGVIQQNEHQIIKNLLHFQKILAKDIMTPRTVVKAARESMTISDFHELNPNLRFSRIPIYSKSMDEVSGFILKDVLLSKMIEQEGHLTLKEISRPILNIAQDLPVPKLFEDMMSARQQIVLVHDEYGGMAGIVTMEDIMETLLGLEIVDELDDTVDMQSLARKKWEDRARKIGLLDQTDPNLSES